MFSEFLSLGCLPETSEEEVYPSIRYRLSAVATWEAGSNGSRILGFTTVSSFWEGSEDWGGPLSSVPLLPPQGRYPARVSPGYRKAYADISQAVLM
jgi:hypothetical protein